MLSRAAITSCTLKGSSNGSARTNRIPAFCDAQIAGLEKAQVYVLRTCTCSKFTSRNQEEHGSHHCTTCTCIPTRARESFSGGVFLLLDLSDAAINATAPPLRTYARSKCVSNGRDAGRPSAQRNVYARTIERRKGRDRRNGARAAGEKMRSRSVFSCVRSCVVYVRDPTTRPLVNGSSRPRCD